MQLVIRAKGCFSPIASTTAQYQYRVISSLSGHIPRSLNFSGVCGVKNCVFQRPHWSASAPETPPWPPSSPFPAPPLGRYLVRRGSVAK